MTGHSKAARHSGDHGAPTYAETRMWRSAGERIAEIGEILAAGLMRLRARKSSGLLPRGADSFLGSLARQSGAIAELEGDGT